MPEGKTSSAQDASEAPQPFFEADKPKGARGVRNAIKAAGRNEEPGRPAMVK